MPVRYDLGRASAAAFSAARGPCETQGNGTALDPARRYADNPQDAAPAT